MAVTELPVPPPGSPEPILTTEVRTEGTATVVALSGEADVSTRWIVSNVLARLIALPTGDVVVDLTHLTFIDSATVRLLSMTQELLAGDERRLTLRSPTRTARRVLEILELEHLLEVTSEDPG